MCSRRRPRTRPRPTSLRSVRSFTPYGGSACTSATSRTGTHPAANLASAQQKGAEASLRDAAQALADAERAYRIALARKITSLRAEGLAATTCADVARGSEEVADLRWKRDVAQGVRDAAEQAAWRLSADRRTIQGLSDWAARRELAEHGQPDSRVAWTPKVAA
jgi:hypothetical protein